jgi:peptidoglycan hydrolase-like protein with peptidoglycan-binding domain
MPLLQVHAVDVDRLELKKALKQAGYYHHDVTGSHPKEVENAIRKYQQDHGMAVTGQVTDILLQSLGLAKATTQPAHTAPAAVAQVQPAPPAPPSVPKFSPPSAQISPFLDKNLNVVLSPLAANAPLPRQQAVELREHFADEMAKAPDPQKPTYKQAMVVMDMMIAAMDEREKALTDARHSSMPGVQDTHDARVTVKGRHGRAAVKSERMENNKDQQAARQKGQFLEENAVKQWADRTNVLRQTISRAYDIEREQERAIQ